MNPWDQQQLYAPPPGYPVGGPPVHPRPSGVTAVSAGVLGLLGGLLPLAGTLLAVAGFGLFAMLVAGPEAAGEAVAGMSLLVANVFVPLVGSLILVAASVVLLRRGSAARYVVAAVCSALIVHSLIGLSTRFDTSDAVWSVLYVVIAVLALLPSTGRWCAARR